jgi:hypothetical protein
MLSRLVIAVLVILLAALIAVCWVAGMVCGAFRKDHGWYEP